MIDESQFRQDGYDYATFLPNRLQEKFVRIIKNIQIIAVLIAIDFLVWYNYNEQKFLVNKYSISPIPLWVCGK